ncbi:HK97 family phage prohead protease [Nitrobacter sp.]|uniref:HK97 family phage prohead protease n=1 Tax=Nitrobacter sp. TaxID=29420 RepID=UPI0029CAAC08|nr:HK97 family phage prohead protease [Nitrobacter sp.]
MLERKEGFQAKVSRNFWLAEVKFSNGKDDPPGTFSGYGAVFSNEDDGGDVIMPGAFTDTLAAWKARKKLPKMLWQHGCGDDADDMLPIGVWTDMEEDGEGLAVKGRLIALDTDRGATIYEGMQSGAIDALSITYCATDVIYGSKEGDPFRTIRKLDLYEVGPVLFGMNADALINEAKAASRIRTVRDFEGFLRDVGGFSKEAAKAIASSGFKANPIDRDDRGVADAFADQRKRAAGLFTNP